MKKKCVLVTGASRGIGKACAFAFASLGCHVFINCRNSILDLTLIREQILLEGGSCSALQGDVGCAADVAAIFEQIACECDGLDVLVNNAGIAHVGLLTDCTDENWNEIIQTNLSSAFYCSRAAIPHMVSKKSGKIINISSMWGTTGASCEVAYSASKAGLHGLTKALAKELAPSSVQVNAIACGVIDTPMNAQLSIEERALLAEEIPAGRFGTADEVAQLVLSLSQGHEYLTGQIIGLDGGFI